MVESSALSFVGLSFVAVSVAGVSLIVASIVDPLEISARRAPGHEKRPGGLRARGVGAALSSASYDGHRTAVPVKKVVTSLHVAYGRTTRRFTATEPWTVGTRT
jgi:hypothetical protein